jgi:hypothetical protein
VVTTSFRLGAPDSPPPPDATPPLVSIATPADGATVSGPIAVAATASDDVAVANVQFQIDGINRAAAQTAPPYGFTWDSTTTANGPHSITAMATDASGNTRAATAAVTVANQAIVPDLVNSTEAAATTALTNAGLKTGTVTTAPSPSVPIGSVVSQSVPPGTLAAPGTSVDLVVSMGVTVPVVTGETGSPREPSSPPSRA